MESGQETRPCRRFGLADGLILMAALAVTPVLLKDQSWIARLPHRIPFWWQASLELLGLRRWSFAFYTRAEAAHRLAIEVNDEIFVQLLPSVLHGLTLAQPILRLRRPWPAFPDVLRQSGLVACLSVIVVWLVIVDYEWIAGRRVWYGCPLALAVLLLWPLAGVFPWRSEASWIDRLGRVGWGWIIAAAAWYLYHQL